MALPATVCGPWPALPAHLSYGQVLVPPGPRHRRSGCCLCRRRCRCCCRRRAGLLLLLQLLGCLWRRVQQVEADEQLLHAACRIHPGRQQVRGAAQRGADDGTWHARLACKAGGTGWRRWRLVRVWEIGAEGEGMPCSEQAGRQAGSPRPGPPQCSPWDLYSSAPVAAPASTLLAGLSWHRTSRLASWTAAAAAAAQGRSRGQPKRPHSVAGRQRSSGWWHQRGRLAAWRLTCEAAGQHEEGGGGGGGEACHRLLLQHRQHAAHRHARAACSMETAHGSTAPASASGTAASVLAGHRRRCTCTWPLPAHLPQQAWSPCDPPTLPPLCTVFCPTESPSAASSWRG